MAGLVRQIMSPDPVTVAPDASVEEVVRLLRRHELPGLPVVDADGGLLGIVTESDLVIADDEGDLHLPHYVELCAVVKADGYGHGAVQCGRAALAGGAGSLAVATAGEAAELRGAGIDGRLLVMGALTAPEVRVALLADAEVVAWTREFVAALP